MYTNRDLKNLILPLLVEQVLVILVGMADTVMVSSLGDAAVSGVSLVDQLCNVILVLLAALATGGAVVSSQLLGAQRRSDACRVSNQLMMVVTAVSLAITGIILAARGPLLKLLFSDVEPDVMANALTYLEITALSYPLIGIYNAGTALYRSMNKSRVTMLVSVAVNVVNVCGNAICIHGLGMGVEGAAIPTLISRGVGAVCMFILLRKPNLQIHLMHGHWKPDFRMIREILHIGVPSGVENSMFQLGRLLVLRVITVFGTVQIAANSVANVLDNLGIIPCQAINLAIISVIGRCVGAQDYKQVRYYTKKLMLWSYASLAVLNVPLLLTLKWTLPIFNVSKEALELATILIWIHDGLAMLFWPLAFGLPNALRAASDVKYTMYVSIGSMVLFRIVFSYILGIGLGWGAIGVWSAMILDWLCRITFFILRYRGSKWEKMAQIHT